MIRFSLFSFSICHWENSKFCQASFHSCIQQIFYWMATLTEYPAGYCLYGGLVDTLFGAIWHSFPWTMPPLPADQLLSFEEWTKQLFFFENEYYFFPFGSILMRLLYLLKPRMLTVIQARPVECSHCGFKSKQIDKDCENKLLFGDSYAQWDGFSLEHFLLF